MLSSPIRAPFLSLPRPTAAAPFFNPKGWRRYSFDVLRSYVASGRFKIHDFVVMPDHFHLLITLDTSLSIERAIQLIKGNFSFRAKREVGVTHEIWQRGFSDERVRDRESFLAHRAHIGQNPVERGLAKSAEEYPYSSFYLRKQKKARRG